MEPRPLKVAIVHYWLVSMRGGEKVIEELCKIYPQADIFTLVCRPERLSETIRAHKITTSFLQKIPKAASIYQSLLPLMPLAVEQFDLTGYDVVISSDTNVMKGAVTLPSTLHVCYCNTPMRYAWDMYHQYLNGSGLGRIKKLAMVLTMHYMRMWDVAASNRVDKFIGNSRYICARIEKHYRRDAVHVYPPVDVEGFRPGTESGDFYMMLGQIIPYKRVDIAVDAFNRSGRRLIIVGEGSEVERLRNSARPNVEFLGFLDFETIKKYYQSCRAFIFPGEEDFGITPLEAQACGRPVIAFGRGGALETVIDRETGLFFDAQTPEDLERAVERFEAGEHAITAAKCVANAARFSAARFREEMRSFIERAWEAHTSGGSREKRG